MSSKLKSSSERKIIAKPNVLRKWLVRLGILATLLIVFSYLDSIKVSLLQCVICGILIHMGINPSIGGMSSNQRNCMLFPVLRLTNTATTLERSSRTSSRTSLPNILPLRSASSSTLARMSGSSTMPVGRWVRCMSSMQASPNT